MNKPTSQEVAYNYLLKNIVAGKYASGAPLREEKIAEECQVSSTPVREAFRRLEKEGWLESVPYKGSFLKKFSPDEVREIYLMREVLECVAAGEAMSRATEGDWLLVEQALALEREEIANCQNSDAAPAGRMRAPFQSDVDFHNALAKASHCKRIMEQGLILNLQLRTVLLSTALELTLPEIKDIHEQHLAIYSNLRRGWRQAAEEMIRLHVATARDRMLAMLNGEAPRE